MLSSTTLSYFIDMEAYIGSSISWKGVLGIKKYVYSIRQIDFTKHAGDNLTQQNPKRSYSSHLTKLSPFVTSDHRGIDEHGIMKN